MRIYKKNNSIFDTDLLADLAYRLKLPVKFIELLFLRGINSEEKIQKYIHPEKNDFYDPYAFKNMKPVIERLKQAAAERQRVVVYCDYDADGICAGAILSLFLSSVGVEVSTYVPSRSGDGYGLRVESLDKIIEDVCPDLILTCDCGISSAAEVDYVLDLGVDIIITDHHEVSDRLPDCLIINPHIVDSGYPFAHLSGAGVAFKIVQAYLGEQRAEEYEDMAAIATIADLVPLMDENRLLVQRGLKCINKHSNLGIAKMLERLEINQITSTDVAFKIAPRINAAGRMGDASRALRLLISDDIVEINSILDEIEADNTMRRQVSDDLYADAIADLRYQGLAGRYSIALSYPNKEKGITGIVAARLAGEFKRPTFLMVRSGDHYKGTARSIEGINIYKALTSVSDLLIEFGGHEQAAGFSIAEQQIESFSTRIEEYVKGFSKDCFLPSFGYDIDVVENELNYELVKALELMEPFGNGNVNPLFHLQTAVLNVTPCKGNPVHTQVQTEGKLSIMAFNYSRKNQILLGAEKKDIVIEAQLSGFSGVRGILRQAAGQNLYINNDIAKANFIKMLNIKSPASVNSAINFFNENSANNKSAIPYAADELFKIISEDIYGNLLIAGCQETYDKFMRTLTAKRIVLKEFIYSTTKNNYNRIIISPDFDENLLFSLYDKIVFLDSPIHDKVISHIRRQSNAEIFVPQTIDHSLFLSGISLERDVFGYYFEAIRQNAAPAQSLYSYYFNMSKSIAGLDIRQFIVCLTVFNELGLTETSKNGGFLVTVNKGKRAELKDSETYKYLSQKLENL